ncbi:Ku protein [Schlesneria sp. T3-172]|uniref:non-homologous end joining protein Ku n=1 Tax=Schlesneria sphaerica TaxID=3373610 RepID=UPI0037CA8334
MSFRSSWKGYLKLSLVSVPVKAYSAVSSDEGEIHFNQLHEKCHSRIKYVKTCPKHGAVPSEEIVSGYEYAKGQYVVMDSSELAALRADKEKSVNVEAIVPVGAIDPMYLTEKSSYLIPDGRVGEKPYAVIEQCLASQNSIAVGRLVINGKDEVVMIRPLDGLLVLTVLSGAAQVKQPGLFASELPKVSVSAAEVKMTKTLFEAYYQDEIDLAQFTDQYTERVAQLVESKIKGDDIVTSVSSEEPDVINLMDALKKSVEQAKSHSRKTKVMAEKTPAKTTRLKTPAKRKSKSA